MVISGLVLGALAVLSVVQTTRASIVGMVRDGGTGQPLAGAVVVLPDLVRSSIANAEGRYLVRDLPAGPHHLIVRYLGYAPRTLHALVPRVGELALDVSLRALPVRLPPVNIRPLASVRGTGHGGEATLVERGGSAASIRDHPLLTEPDVFQFLAGGEVLVQPESPSGVHVRGGAADHTGYLLDGVPILSPYHVAGLFSAWNPDAIAEISLASDAPSPAMLETLSGSVVGTTRMPGVHHAAQGGFSSTHARLTADGPLSSHGAGYLLSVRSGFPGIVAPRDESYLSGASRDWLAKVETPMFGGHARLLGYGSDNHIDVAAIKAAVDRAPRSPRNAFDWASRSLGGEWRRVVAQTAVRLSAWSAASDAGAVWLARSGTMDLTTARRDMGIQVTAEPAGDGSSTMAGVRLERIATNYRVMAADARAWEPTRATIATAFAERGATLTDRLSVRLAGSIAGSADGVHVSPRAQLRWHPTDRWTATVSVTRLHQFTQSLRNPESVVGTVFPADLSVVSEGRSIPVARSDQGAIAAEWRPSGGVRLAMQGYLRALRDLVLVAPATGEPFAVSALVAGKATARGASLDAAFGSARFGAVATYAVQRVRYEGGATTFVPAHGATHFADVGVVAFPSPTISLRLGISGAAGRRTTRVASDFEWESCNISDRGCEFVGSPHHNGQPLGAAVLPAYLRGDIGVRKHWHADVGGRDGTIALYAVASNVFGHRNVLTFAPDPQTGAQTAVFMRPRAPLVMGLDWRF